MPSKLKVPEHSTSLSLAFTNMQNFLLISLWCFVMPVNCFGKETLKHLPPAPLWPLGSPLSQACQTFERYLTGKGLNSDGKNSSGHLPATIPCKRM